MRAVPYLRPQGGVQGAKGQDLPQPSALKEAEDGGAVDYQLGDGGRASVKRTLH